MTLNVFTTFLHNSFIACIRLVTVKSCLAKKCGFQIGNEYHFCSSCGHKRRSEVTNSVPLQLRDSILTNLTQFVRKVIVMFLRLYHNINISKRTLERRLSNVSVKELKNVIESEIQRPASMRDYHVLWHSLKKIME